MVSFIHLDLKDITNNYPAGAVLDDTTKKTASGIEVTADVMIGFTLNPVNPPNIEINTAS